MARRPRKLPHRRSGIRDDTNGLAQGRRMAPSRRRSRKKKGEIQRYDRIRGSAQRPGRGTNGIRTTSSGGTTQRPGCSTNRTRKTRLGTGTRHGVRRPGRIRRSQYPSKRGERDGSHVGGSRCKGGGSRRSSGPRPREGRGWNGGTRKSRPSTVRGCKRATKGGGRTDRRASAGPRGHGAGEARLPHPTDQETE